MNPRLILTVLAIVSAIWSAAIWETGGIRFTVFGADIRSTDPFRPLAFAFACFLVRIFVFRKRSVWNEVVDVAHTVTPSIFCWTLAAAVFIVGAVRGSAGAGGADQYGYVSQADLWLRGDLVTPQLAADRVPWPDGQWTLSPLGYRPSVDRHAIVPTYAPGLPLLLAVFKLAGGQCAMALVVPLAAAILVLATFYIGREVVSENMGAAGAWLVATSPIVLFMMMSPMSDVPAAACWALAAYGCLRGNRIGVLSAGIGAAGAILIRPNLAHVAVIPALWLLSHDLRSLTGRSRFRRTALFSAPVAVACLFIAGLNQHLYGAATASGYGGGIEAVFKSQYVKENILNYAMSLVRSQTPFALAGLAVSWIPSFFIRSERVQMRGRGLLGGMSFVVAVSYVFYESFEPWWYLRFLLPCWPAMSLTVARILARPSGLGFSPVSRIALLMIGLYGLYFAYDTSAFDLGKGDQRYVRVATLVAGVTEPNSVVITLQHSGSLRYYGGRTTIRYDTLDARWLDRAVFWFRDRGIHPYILLDDWEHEVFRNRFASRNVIGRLEIAKVLEYRHTTSTTLYDPLKHAMSGDEPHVVRAPRRRDRSFDCSGPAPYLLSAF